MAERIAMIRAFESRKPEGERICYDPYAVRFIDPDTMESIVREPEKFREEWGQFERRFPGLESTVVARVRYFDDFVRNAICEGIEQLVILGAGYDTRAYRIEGLEKVRTFEVDHPGTSSVKVEKVREIFGALPGHVAYVPVDFETESLGRKLSEHGYGPSKKTLFLMEGLVMYLPVGAVDELLSFIRSNSGRGSSVIFDYVVQFDVENTAEREARMSLREYAEKAGEPAKSGIRESTLETFLADRGFSRIRNVTSEDYKKMYFSGKSNVRVLKQIYFAHAVIE